MAGYKMTYHASVERYDRLAECIDTVGFNSIICEIVDRRNPDTINVITDTGILFVRAVSTGKIITGYMADIRRLNAIFAGRLPNSLYKTVISNMKKYPHLCHCKR